MKLSSGSTNKGVRAGGVWLVLLFLTGCQAAKTPPPLVPAHADLAVLVHLNPGWRSVGQFDGMLARLRAAIRQARVGGSIPVPALSLPAEAGLDLPGEAFTMPADALAQEQRQLREQAAAQVARLRMRRDLARQQQLDVQQVRWQRDAQLRYAQAVQDALDHYRQSYNAAFAAGDVRRLNLALQIHALRKTVDDWKLSTPPTPLLDKASRDLALKTAELKRLEDERVGTTGELQRQRDRAIAEAATARDAYVGAQRTQLAGTLHAQDEVSLAVQQRQLARQTALLLRQERALAAGTVKTVGSVGSLHLPPNVAEPQTPGRDLEAAVRQLQAQRTRWIAFLYKDTQAAALDAARQRGWNISFNPSGREGANVTDQMAVMLAKNVWKV